MQLIDLHDDETLDELDKARAADMDERPIYPSTSVADAEEMEPELEEAA